MAEFNPFTATGTFMHPQCVCPGLKQMKLFLPNSPPQGRKLTCCSAQTPIWYFTSFNWQWVGQGKTSLWIVLRLQSARQSSRNLPDRCRAMEGMLCVYLLSFAFVRSLECSRLSWAANQQSWNMRWRDHYSKCHPALHSCAEADSCASSATYLFYLAVEGEVCEEEVAIQSSCPLGLFVHSWWDFQQKARILQKKKAFYKIGFNLRHGWEPNAETAHRVFILLIAVKDCAVRNVLSCCGVRVFLS